MKAEREREKERDGQSGEARVRRVATTIERSDDIGVERRRLNRCNELIDWRCLRDCHRYTPETRLHVRWLSVQRRPRVTVNRRPPPFLPDVPFSRATPSTRARARARFLSAGRKSDKCAELSACQICSTLHAASLFSRRAPVRQPELTPARTRRRGCLFFSLGAVPCVFGSRKRGSSRKRVPLLPASVAEQSQGGRARRGITEGA